MYSSQRVFRVMFKQLTSPYALMPTQSRMFRTWSSGKYSCVNHTITSRRCSLWMCSPLRDNRRTLRGIPYRSVEIGMNSPIRRLLRSGGKDSCGNSSGLPSDRTCWIFRDSRWENLLKSAQLVLQFLLISSVPILIVSIFSGSLMPYRNSVPTHPSSILVRCSQLFTIMVKLASMKLGLRI